ncbi:MAG: Hsp20/alpha crystallin family protein [Myxococcales bacterium]
MAEDRLSRRGQLGRHWDPFRQMRELMQWDPLEHLMPLVSGRESQETGFVPAFEVKETKDAFLFKGDLPGVKEEDVELSVTGNRLTVSGRREAERKDESDTWYAYERSFGAFSRTFTLPEGVNTDDVRAELKDGVLTIAVPKATQSVSKRIPLKKDKESAKA